jgi:hypothetical protein
MKNKLFTLIIVCILMCTISFASDYYVDVNKGSDTAGDGSKEKPWETITYVLTNVEGSKTDQVIIHIKAGTYDVENDEEFPIYLGDFISLKGENPFSTIIDASGDKNTVLYLKNIQHCSIENLTITGGNGNYHYYEEESPYRSGDWCTIESSSYTGGGICCEKSSLSIKNCIIRDNFACRKNLSYTQKQKSKPKYFTSEAEPQAESVSNSYYGCHYYFEYYNGYGGGIYCDFSDLTISNSIIANNRALEDDDSIGGGIYCVQTTLNIQNSNIVHNYSKDSADIYCFSSYTIDNSILWNNISFNKNALFSLILKENLNDQFNVTIDPIFVSGPWGDYYLSQKAAGQDKDSPCLNAGSDLAANLGLAQMTTRTDGVLDTGKVDIGYHYPPPVQFGLYIEPEKECYQNEDILTIRLDLSTCPQPVTADIYFILYDPSGIFWSGMSWSSGLKPVVSSLTLPNISISDAALLTFTIPCENPPISAPGIYIFGLAAAKPGTMDLISNLATAKFEVR